MAKKSAPKKEDEGLRLRVKPGDQLSISIRVEAPPQADKAGYPAQAKKPGFFASTALAIRAFFQRQKVSAFLKKAFSPMGLFILGCALFTLTRFIRLPDFPLYFSCDEALTSLRGLDLVRDLGFDYNGYFLPPLFLNDGKYSLGTTVYLQILPLLAFGKSVWVARGVSSLVSLLGVIWFSLLARDLFKLKLWWAGAFLLGVTPAWFLLSRTAFETAQMTALYAGALYYYFLYRAGRPRFLFASIVLAAMAFYAYLPGEAVVVLTILALAFIDIKTHIRNWKTALPALGVLVLLALPMVNFVRVHPEHYAGAMAHYGSYIASDLSTAEKVQVYLGNYLQGISPLYWFNPRVNEDVHYLMKGYGHILLIFLPFAVWGAVRLVRRRSLPEFLAVLVPLLTAPVAGALLKTEVTRTLVVILPYGWLILLGLEAGADWLEGKRVRRGWITAGLAVLLGVGQVYMLTDALTRGPLWWNDYGISGIQYGANQVFKEALDYSQEYPDTKVYISGGWIFQADALKRFFVPPGAPVDLATPDQMPDRIASGEDLTFVVIPEEFKRLEESGDYAKIQVEKTLPCPDGSPCFRFIKLQFKPAVLENLQAAAIEKSQPVETGAVWNGMKLDAELTALSDGKVGNLFDGNNETFIRSAEINPLVIDLGFPQRTPLTGVQVRVGSEPVTLTVTVNPDDPQKKQVFTQSEGQSDGYKEILVDFGSALDVEKLEIAVKNMLSPEKGFVHIWELQLLQAE